MLCNRGYFSIALLILLAFSNNVVVGQSITIRRNAKYEAMIEANSPMALGYRLQASGEFHDWEDFGDQVSGPLSYRLDRDGTNRFFRLRTWTTEDAPITLVMIGDSTVADFAINNNWFSGWGQGIYGYLKPNVRVVNLARAGNSTKFFLNSNEMQTMLRIKPDFVLVHFGFADTHWPGVDFLDHVTTITEYEANLKTIVQKIRDFKGTPIMMTPVNARIFSDQNIVFPLLQEQCGAVKNVAAASQTYVIDLNLLSRNLFNKLGDNGSAYISWSDTDLVHFSLEGADVIAGLVVKAFPNILRPQVVETASGNPTAKP
jgi:lysophospholipase L1-like esterase